MSHEPRAAVVDRRDLAIAGACALIAFTAYLRTLAPGATSDVDSAMFQFLGRVLGVAHNPGYPLYALVTWPIAQIPFGELAWRINLFSAVMAALAVGLTVAAARRLGCSRTASAVAGLGLAAGATFWSQAVVAEVYTLHLVFVAALLQAALRWEATGRPAHFYVAVAWLAAGLGHHTTIAAFAPALALHAVLVDRRFALRLRTIAAAAGICLLGLLPYLYILIRSRDPQAYVESRATTLDGLVQVVLGRQFRERLFTDAWTTIVTERVPALVASVLRPDVTIVGLVLATIGAAWLLRRRLATAALLLTPMAIVIAFVAGYAVVDQPVFLLPAVLCLWLLAAAGLDRVAALLEQATPNPRLAAAVGGAAVVAALAVPATLAARHAPIVDRSRDRSAARHVAALIAALPARAAIVTSDFIAERMVHYELLGRDAAAGRAIAVAPRDAPSIAALVDRGVEVVAFPGAVDHLRLAGLDVSADAVALADGPLDRVIAELPPGTIVGLALPAAHATALRRASRTAWAALGLAPDWGGTATAEHVAVAVVGDARAARATSASGAAQLSLGGGEGPWRGRARLELAAAGSDAAIRLGGRDLIRTSDGAALALWAPDGVLQRVAALRPADGYQVPLTIDAMSAYPLLGRAVSQAVPRDVPVDATALASTGSITATVPAGGVLRLDAVDRGALAPYVVAQEGAPRVEVEPAAGAAGTRLSIAAASRPAAVHVIFGAIPDRLTARLEGGASPGQVRRAATTGLLRGPDRRSAVIRMTRDDQVLLLGPGWSPVEADDAGPYRWTVVREARLVLPPSPAAWRTLTLEVFAPGAGGASAVAVHVDGVALAAQPVAPGWQVRRWALPPAITEALRRKPAEVSVVVEGAPGPRGLAVASLRFADAD